MTLTPAQITAKKFKATTLRTGYDPKEVDDFLDEVSAALADALDQTQQLPTIQVDTQPAIPPYVGDVMRLLNAAQQAADQQLAEAKQEADQLLSDAKTQSAQLVDEAEQQKLLVLGRIEEQRATAQANLEAVQSALRQARMTLTAAVTLTEGSVPS